MIVTFGFSSVTHNKYILMVTICSFSVLVIEETILINETVFLLEMVEVKNISACKHSPFYKHSDKIFLELLKYLINPLVYSTLFHILHLFIQHHNTHPYKTFTFIYLNLLSREIESTIPNEKSCNKIIENYLRRKNHFIPILIEFQQCMYTKNVSLNRI